MDVSLDQNALNALECPICYSPFAGSIIFQCSNGHALCQACHVRICTENQNCPTCMAPIGESEIRSRPLENVIDGMVFPCAFVSHGCTRRLKYAGRQVHEASCPNGPCECPFPGCHYSALVLNDHIREAHAAAEDGDAVVSFAGSAQVTLYPTTQFRVLLHALDGCVFLLLNGGDVPAGRSLSVVCLGGRRPTGNRVLQYKLEVSGGGVPGTLPLAASGSVPCVRSLTGHHPTDEGFLLVPDAYWSTSGSVSVTVHVWNSTTHKAVYALRCYRGLTQETLEFWSFAFLFSVIAVVLAWMAS